MRKWMVLGLFVAVAAVTFAASNFRIDELPDGATMATTDLVEIYRDQTGTKSFSLQLQDIAGTSTVAELNKLDGLASGGYLSVTEGFSFTESAATTYTATVEIPAGAVVQDICFTSTVLWGGTSASLGVGDDDDADGWFTTVDLKATDLLVGEVICAADDGAWGGVDGAYLTTAGRRGRTTAGVDSGWYYGAASEVIFVITAGTPSTTGRSFGWVTYVVPTFTASTDT